MLEMDDVFMVPLFILQYVYVLLRKNFFSVILLLVKS
jgi:hypothetical protein